MKLRRIFSCDGEPLSGSKTTRYAPFFKHESCLERNQGCTKFLC